MQIDAESMLLAALLLAAALLYSSVGHGGASGYLAAMALLGVSPAIMKPTALALNILVALITTFKFYRVGSFSWRIFIPLAIAAVPLAYLGGRLSLPVHFYKPLVGAVLMLLSCAMGLTSYLVDAQIPDQLLEIVKNSIHSPLLFLLVLNIVLWWVCHRVLASGWRLKA